MADLVTRLLLNSDQFDNNIKKSTQQTQKFQKTASNIAGAVSKFAGGIGLAVGAFETFNTAVNSCATSQKTFQTVIGTAKESVDSFFTSLTTGDWSIFEDGIINAIKLSKQYVESMRQVGTIIKFGDVKLSENEMLLNKYELEATNPNSTPEQRLEGYRKFQEQAQRTIQETTQTVNEANKELSEALAGKGITIKDARQLRTMLLTNLDPATKEYKELMKYIELRDDATGFFDANFAATRPTKELWAKTQNSYMDNLAALYENFGTDEEQDKLLDMLDRLILYEDRLETAKRQIKDVGLEYEKIENEEHTTKIKTKIDPVLPEGSLAEIQKQISAKKLEFKMAIDQESRYRLDKEIAALEREERTIIFKAKFGDRNIPLENSNPLAGLNTGRTPEIKGEIKMPKVETPVDNMDEFLTSINAINSMVSAISSLSQMKEDDAASWLNWTATVLTSIASVLPAISTLVAARTAEAGANAGAEVSKIPVVGWLMAGAAIASVLAAFASLPSFSTGGIFAGNNTIGDMNLARVNAGEMILNNRQQRNLFNLLNGEGSSFSNTANVQFKIKGTDLIGVLDNYNRKIKKVR